MEAPRWIDATEIRQAVSPDRARRLVRQVLADGFDPAEDPERLSPVVPGGQLLIMPSSTPHAVGVKALSVAPGNPDRGLERIQALYVLFDADTLAPSIILDGTAITALRTPAVSAVAIEALAPADVSSVVVFGSGPQAVGHVEAILEIRQPDRVTIVGRGLEAARAAAHQVSGLGVTASALSADDGHVAQVVADSGVVVTATSSGSPVLDGEWVADGACVVAIGSHEPNRRELDSRLVGRSLVVVEDVATALREAGDVVMAIGEGTMTPQALHPMTQLLTGQATRATDRPNVFKSVGMSWEDLVIAAGAAHC
ncbi:MAG TPA: ornithine cyclodeaminase family protein [Intrasporangium sp.]|uniref:ornithine cyclodeaminase family protein n=1 Tax=Intrasporangium sp. TaxID=1925024 RepID=UPI002F9458FF